MDPRDPATNNSTFRTPQDAPGAAPQPAGSAWANAQQTPPAGQQSVPGAADASSQAQDPISQLSSQSAQRLNAARQAQNAIPQVQNPTLPAQNPTSQTQNPADWFKPKTSPAVFPKYPAEPDADPYSVPGQYQFSQPHLPAAPDRPQPSYEQPFRPAPSTPQYPYQPIRPDPAVNPYAANPQLPDVAAPAPQAAQRPAPVSPPPSQPQPVPVPQPQPTENYLSTPVPGHSRRFKVFMTITFLLVLAAAGAIAYLFYSPRDDKPAQKPATTQPAPKPAEEQPAETPQPPQNKPEEAEKPAEPAPAPQPAVLALGDFTRASFTAPANIPDGYSTFDYKTPGVTAYRSADRACELQFGTLSAEALPGDNSNDIIGRQIQELRNKGGSFGDPTAMADLKLAHPTDPNKTSYNLPSYSFTGTMASGRHVRTHYAVAILKDGSRAYVLRTCSSLSAPVDGAALDPVESFAAGIGLKPER